VNTNDAPKSAEAGELPEAVGAKEASKAAETAGPKKKSNCFSDMVNKLCRLCSRENELREMKAMLKDILREMRKDGTKKKYEIDDVGATTDRIEEAIREMKDAINKQRRSAWSGRWNAFSFSLYSVGLAIVAYTNKVYPGLAIIAAGIGVNVIVFLDAIIRQKAERDR